MSWKEYLKTGKIKSHCTNTLLDNIFEGVSEGGFKLNVAKVPVKKARMYAEKEFEKAGKKLDEVIPDFDSNYKKIQDKIKKAKDVPRVEMPVIEPKNMDDFKNRLNKGHIDIFKPVAKDKWDELKGISNKQFPKDLNAKEGSKWLNLGKLDGKNKDDVVKAKMTKMSSKDLLPSQSQIWLEKLISNIIKFGVPEEGGFITKATIIVTKDKYILDGHHRWGQIMLANPKVKLTSLFIPIDFELLLKVGRSYGNAIGNIQKQNLEYKGKMI